MTHVNNHVWQQASFIVITRTKLTGSVKSEASRKKSFYSHVNEFES